MNRKAQQFANRGSSPKHASRCRNVPARLVVSRIDRISDTRLGFESHDERMQELAPRNSIRAGICKERGRDRRSRMDVVHRRRVVIFENVPADSVDQRGVKRIEAFRPRKQACRRAARIGQQSFDRGLHGRLPAAPYGAAYEIEKSALRFTSDVAGNAFSLGGHDI